MLDLQAVVEELDRRTGEERDVVVVSGSYVLEAPEGDCSAAVRITDTLGEEILVVEERA
ncbi:MAG: hypothetical protein ACXWXR_08585 [Candidatus Limnocylindrales bacterium]